MVSNIGLNFIVNRGGKLAKSLLCYNSSSILNLKTSKYIKDKTSIIPEYLYHFTTKKHYQYILRDGCIKPHSDGTRFHTGFKGIFTVDMKNFISNWKPHPDYKGYDLRFGLIQHISNNSNDLVLLKIPTKLLDITKLRVRSQNLLEKVANKKSLFCEAIGIKAKNKNKYENLGHAIEYIYPQNISTKYIESAKEIDNLESILNRFGISKFDGQPSYDKIENFVKYILSDIGK